MAKKPARASGRDRRQLAMDLAHKRTGHHILCGINEFDCAACEGEFAQIMEMDERALLEELGLPVPELEDAPDAITHELADLYLTVIHPGRCADLMAKPHYFLDIARIGDEVVARARAKALKPKSPTSR